MIKFTLSLLGILFSATSFAFWRCPAIDFQLNKYYVDNKSIDRAINKSLSKCRKNSEMPKSCLVERSFCQQLNSTDTSHIQWRCYSYDRTKTAFRTPFYTNQYEAAIAAKIICRRLSKYPSSCYVHLSGCEKP